MKRTILLFATMACMTITSLPAQEAAVNKIIETGRSDNQVMNHLDILTNRFGGRPIGSERHRMGCLQVQRMGVGSGVTGSRNFTRRIQPGSVVRQAAW